MRDVIQSALFGLTCVLGPCALAMLWTRHEVAGAALVGAQLACFVAWVACCARAVGRVNR